MAAITTDEESKTAGFRNYTSTGTSSNAGPRVQGGDDTTEHNKAGIHGLWDTNKVFTMQEVCDVMRQAADQANQDPIEEVVRKRSMANIAEAGSRKKRKKETAVFVSHPDAEQRKKRLPDATAAAAKQSKDETVAKHFAAVVRTAELNAHLCAKLGWMFFDCSSENENDELRTHGGVGKSMQVPFSVW